MTYTIGSLCAGYGGIEQALRLAGWPAELAWVADNDLGAAKILAHRHPDVPNLGDITAVDWAAVAPTDILTAGFPCTDISCAGRMAGMGVGTRSGIWAHVAEAIAALRPRLVVVENVAALLSTRANRSTDARTDSDLESGPAGMGDGTGRPVLRAAGAVLGDLACLGFDAVWATISAASVGAPHRRNRVFILAWPADAPRIRLGHTGTAGERRPPPAAVVGAVQPGGVALLPTPAARLGDSHGTPTPDLAAVRMYDEGRRNLDDAVALLPTPRTNEARGPGAHGDGGPDLRTAISLLPTPRARDHKGRDPNPRGVDLNEALALLPTPRATDGTKGGPNQRGSSGDLMLPSAVMLLPTPTAVHWARNATADRADVKPTTNDNGWTLADVAQADRWGRYATAIARWETVLGRPAPDPTEPGSKGQPRLSPRFVEWMQGLPDGWVTAVPGLSRNEQLRALGNGVVPLQCAAALQRLARLA
jgi:DNA (cytosine-5)-methyltransferase 1